MDDNSKYRNQLKRTVCHITLEDGMEIDSLTEDEALTVLEAILRPEHNKSQVYH